MAVKKIETKPLPYDAERDKKAREVLLQARVNMLMKHEFWGVLATRMKLINADEWCGTLATDGTNFFYNSEFVLGLTNVNKVVFGFAHEILHCIYDHIGRSGGRDPQLSNIAQDYVINADLVAKKVGEKIDEIDIVFDMKYHDWMWEKVYEDLKSQNMSKQQIEALADKVLDDHLQGEQPGQESGNGNEIKDGVSRGRPSIDQGAYEQSREDFRQAVVEAAKNTKAGNLPAGVERMIRDLTEATINWKDLIAMKVPSLMKNDYSYTKFNKKYMNSGIVMPGLMQEESIDVCIAVDTSGSMSEEQLRDILSEIVGLMDMYAEFTLRIWQFDTKVYGYETFTKDTAEDILSYKVKGGGGTCFRANWEFMEENDITPKLFIFFTDGFGEGYWGEEDAQEDMIWILHGHGSENIVPPHGSYAYYDSVSK